MTHLKNHANIIKSLSWGRMIEADCGEVERLERGIKNLKEVLDKLKRK